MKPREFLKRYKFDKRVVEGTFFPPGPLELVKGDKVAVVLLNLGGPNKEEEIAPFLYNLFMDPAIIDIPLGGILRHWLSSYVSSKRSRKIAKDYAMMGGGSPITHLTEEQSQALEVQLNEGFGQTNELEFKVFTAMRYAPPLSEQAAEAMQQFGATKVVLLPLFPHYSKTSTGSSLAYWWILEQAGEIPAWPTVSIFEYAAHPAYIRAINDRIDEALEAFPADLQSPVQLLFSAHGTPVVELRKRLDPYCCLIHGSIHEVMAQRGHDLPFHVSFQSKVGPSEWMTPSTIDKVKELALAGHKALLVQPISFVTDHIETLVELGVQIREQKEAKGIEHFHVCKGINCHPGFIQALTESVISHVTLPKARAGIPFWNELSHANPKKRTLRCHQCQKIGEPRNWAQGGA